MKTYIWMTAGLALVLASSLAEAKGPNGGMSSSSGGGSHKSAMSAGKPFGNGNVAKSTNNYHLQHGNKFSQGYFYKGKQHTHWTSRSYNKQYGCWTYYCPSTRCSYYWCEPACCYYPVSYCPYKTYCWPASYCCVTVPVVTVTPVVTYQPVVTYKPVVSYQTSVSYNTVKTYGPPVMAEPPVSGPVNTQRPVMPSVPGEPGAPG